MTTQKSFSRIRRLLPSAPQWVGASLAATWIFLLHPLDRYLGSDRGYYFRISLDFVNGRFLVKDTVFPPGYPALGSALASFGFPLLAAMQWVHLLCFVATHWLITSASRRIYGERVALFVSWIFAFHLPVIAGLGFYAPEPVFTCLLALFLFVLAQPLANLSEWRWLGAGFLLGACQWFKGQAVFIAPLLCVWILRTRLVIPSRRLRILGLAAGFAAGIMVLHLFYAGFYGIDRFFPANGGSNLVEGKCPEKKITDSTGLTYHSPLFLQRGESERRTWAAPFWQDHNFWSAGWQCIKDRPWVLATSLRHVYFLFFGNEQWPLLSPKYRPWLSAYNNLFSFLFVASLGLSLFGFRRRARPYAHPILVFPVVALFILVWLFKSELRYRVPFDVFLIPWMVAVFVAAFSPGGIEKRP